MSLRGRVLKRVPWAPDAPAASYQSQLAQYKFLARALHIAQYDSHTFATVADGINWLKTQGKLVTIKSVYAAWNGPEDALALFLPVGKNLCLNLYSANVQGSTFVQSERSGFVYQKADSTWSNYTDLWTQSGPIQEASSACLSIVANKTAMVGSYLIGTIIGDGEYGSWNQTGGIVKACYYVHPFFARLTAVGGYSQTSFYLEEKVY